MSAEVSFLCIEDHPASQRVMELLLKEIMGYRHVTILDNTEDIINRLEEMGEDYDVIFMDLDVQPMGGLETLHVIRQHSRLGKACIVAATASISPGELRQVRRAGFNGLIAKPINPTEFPAQVQQLLQGHEVWEVE